MSTVGAGLAAGYLAGQMVAKRALDPDHVERAAEVRKGLPPMWHSPSLYRDTTSMEDKTVTLPTEPKARKAVPIFSGVLMYFPDAIAAVAELSRIGNDQHNPGQPLHWDRSKSTDEHDALTRHLVEAGKVDTDGVLHSTKVAWRALAALQKEIELRRRHETLPQAQARIGNQERVYEVRGPIVRQP